MTVSHCLPTLVSRKQAPGAYNPCTAIPCFPAAVAALKCIDWGKFFLCLLPLKFADLGNWDFASEGSGRFVINEEIYGHKLYAIFAW